MRCIADNRHQAPRGHTPCIASCVARETGVTRVGILGDPPTFVFNNGDHPDSEVTPTAIPPDEVDSDTPTTSVAPEHVPTPTVPVPTPTPSVIHICDTPGCRRRPESDPCGLVQVSQHVCCGIFLLSDGRQHTNACNAANLTTALSFAPAPAPPSSGNGGSDGRGSSYHDDDW